MPTFEVTEPHRHIKLELMDDCRKALADAVAQGQEVYSVTIANGVPIRYSVRDGA